LKDHSDESSVRQEQSNCPGWRLQRLVLRQLFAEWVDRQLECATGRFVVFNPRNAACNFRKQ
jgi:hypothetical protein